MAEKEKNLTIFQIISVFRVQNPEFGIRIPIRIRIKIKPWIRIQIRLKAYADPKH